MARAAVPGYEVVRLLGKGGMGAVYLGRRVADGQSVAMKLAHRDLGEHGLARLRREAELLGRVRCPHLPRLLDVLDGEDGLVVVMELCEGTPLQSWLEDLPLPPGRLLMLKELAPGLSRALRALHRVGIVHRDIKPPNVLVGPRGAVLVDLGLARGPEVATLTATGLALGTPDYLPPEQVTGEAVGPAADLYQAGLVVRDVLLGSRSLGGGDALQEAVQRSMRLFPDPRPQSPWVPAPVVTWLQAVLHPDPSLRPPADAALAELEALAEGLEVEVSSAPALAGAAAVPSWFASDTVDELVRSRELARQEGWPEAPSGSVWEALNRAEQRAASFSRVSRARVRTPVPEEEPDRSQHQASVGPSADGHRSRLYRWLGMAVLANLGILLGLFSLGPGGARPEPEAAALSLSLEGGLLRVLEGSARVGALSLAEPEARPFERDATGLLRVPLGGGGAGGRLVTLDQDGWRRRAWLPDPARAFDLVLGGGGSEVALRLPVGAPFEVEGALGTGALQVYTRGREDLRFALSAGLLESPELELRVRSPGGVEVVRTLELARELDRRAAAVRVPPDPSLREFEYWGSVGRLRERNLPLGTPDERRFFSQEGPRLAALLAAGCLDEDLRAQRYRELAPFAHAEWMWRRSPLAGEWRANRALGPLLALAAEPGLVPPGPGEGGARGDWPLDVRLGADNVTHRTLEAADAGSTPGERDEYGTFWTRLEGLRPGRPRRVELGLHAVGADAWAALQVHLGAGRVLRLPLGEATVWRFHRLPPRWYQEAVDPGGRLRVGFDFVRDHGYQLPGNFRISRLLVHAVFEEGP